MFFRTERRFSNLSNYPLFPRFVYKTQGFNP
jgi:hypothetical protein